MVEQFVFTCEKCGKDFYSKTDPSNWRHKMCNACSGKPYKDYPVGSNVSIAPTYTPKPVPTIKPVYNKPAIETHKQDFNLQEYISNLLMVYVALRDMIDESGLTIPQENICQWATSIMIQKDKAKFI